MTTRPLFEIAQEIKTVWPAPYFGAVPYIEAMSMMRDATGTFGRDDAQSIVLYFLSNAGTWRGADARRIKAELKALVK